MFVKPSTLSFTICLFAAGFVYVMLWRNTHEYSHYRIAAMDQRIQSIQYNQYSIPQVIHQIWLGPKHPPIQYLLSFKDDYIMQYPHYEYFLWSDFQNMKGINASDDTWNLLHVPHFLQQLQYNNSYKTSHIENITNIISNYEWEPTFNGKSNILRLIILYYFGGIYIDSDSMWIQNNFDDLFNKMNTNTTGFAACAYETSPLIANGVMGFSKQHKIVVNMLNYIGSVDYQSGRKRLKTWQFTGPILLTKFKENMTIFPNHYFYPVDWRGNHDTNLHKKLNYSNETYMFQYGITTNHLTDY